MNNSNKFSILIIGLAFMSACTLPNKPAVAPPDLNQNAGTSNQNAADALPAEETPPPSETPQTENSLAPEPTSTEQPNQPQEPEGPPTLTLAAPLIDPDAAIAHFAVGRDVTIREIKMFSQTIGWAVGGESDPGDHIFTTGDGGKTWKDVTPLEPAAAVGQSEKFVTAFFLDPQRAWVSYEFEDFHEIPNQVIIWYTSDGGSTWQPSDLLEIRGASIEFYNPANLFFADSQNGWFKISVGSGMSHDYSLLFRTSDGGKRWERLIDPVNSDYLQSCCKTGMVFADAQNGIVTADQGPYVQVYVLWTQDGGLTWQTQDLPSPADFPDLFPNAFCESHSPTMFSESTVIMGVTCRQFDDDGNQTGYNFAYTTNDGGGSWTSTLLPSSGGLYMLDANLGIIAGRDIYKTTDGWSSWQLPKTVNWDGQFSFIDAQYGWAVARNEGEIALVVTADAGETWQLIEPVIGN